MAASTADSRGTRRSKFHVKHCLDGQRSGSRRSTIAATLRELYFARQRILPGVRRYRGAPGASRTLTLPFAAVGASSRRCWRRACCRSCSRWGHARSGAGRGVAATSARLRGRPHRAFLGGLMLDMLLPSGPSARRPCRCCSRSASPCRGPGARPNPRLVVVAAVVSPSPSSTRCCSSLVLALTAGSAVRVQPTVVGVAAFMNGMIAFPRGDALRGHRAPVRPADGERVDW